MELLALCSSPKLEDLLTILLYQVKILLLSVYYNSVISSQNIAAVGLLFVQNINGCIIFHMLYISDVSLGCHS
jgi:hypothetical protein